ncbi:arsenate reductase ArsC [Microbulbifer magnicolonia]|uniref:arsenate reductase ArsC n=1 Tax=Microbulbifer magnicolonia TaxID=3109744 RepID=UPI002B402ED1|nr:arsenate reductase ArsC [Microbulbifer sp. GG15]
MKKRVLFLCVGNSARSQMAEALLRHQAGEYFEACSAGTAPEAVDPRAILALEKQGISTAGLHSKPVETFAGQKFDFMITLCDKAQRECQPLPGVCELIAWDFTDPKTRTCPRPFETTLKELGERIKMFALVQTRELSRCL